MISVIVPIYNVEEYITECIKSIMNQTYKDIEIICINDCTQDNSITLVKELQNEDSRIRIINHEENKGLGGARNTGIENAKGEYIVFIDGDDYIDCTMIERLYNSLQEERTDVAVCGVMLFDMGSNEMFSHTTFHYKDIEIQRKYDLCKDKRILVNMWPSACNKLLKKNIIDRHSIKYKEKILYEDHTFYYEYFSKCNNFSYVNRPLYYYRKNRPDSITTTSTGRENEIFKILDYISEIFKDMYDEHTYNHVYAQIAVRLLYERRWIFNENDSNYYDYLREAARYLKKWSKDELLRSKDTFISENDPILLSEKEIDELENSRMNIDKNNDSRAILNEQNVHKKNKLKELIKKLPVVKQLFNLNNERKGLVRNFYRHISETNEEFSKINQYLEARMGELFYEESLNNRKMLQKYSLILEDEIDRNTNKILKYIMQNDQKENSRIEEIKTNMELKINTEVKKIECDIQSLEEKYNLTALGKINDIWWLSWNIKDNLVTNSGKSQSNTKDDNILRYYPTWIPCELPKYFKGNTWFWSDEFKKYYFNDVEKSKKELIILCRNLKEEEISYLETLWKRNTLLIPWSEYVDQEGYLIKKEMIFTQEEIEEQGKIARTYSDIISNYYLPDNTVYEIPVFYYENGLKNMSIEELQYIYNGDILDLGGYIGDSALVLSKHTEKKIYSVELNVGNVDLMKKVLEHNKIEEQVEIIQCAVGKENGEQVYYGESSYSTLNKCVDNKLYVEKEKIQVRSVDSLVQEYNIVPHFIKMDVEGMEFDAIMGAKDTICRFKPILSISIYHTPHDFLHIKPLIESWNLGYSFRIENHNPFDPVYEKMLICIPNNIIS